MSKDNFKESDKIRYLDPISNPEHFNKLYKGDFHIEYCGELTQEEIEKRFPLSEEEKLALSKMKRQGFSSGSHRAMDEAMAEYIKDIKTAK